MLLQDGNMGLVKLVLAGRIKRAIQRLTQTFLTLSLADIAQQVGLQGAAEAEGHILRCCYSVFCDMTSAFDPEEIVITTHCLFSRDFQQTFLKRPCSQNAAYSNCIIFTVRLS